MNMKISGLTITTAVAMYAAASPAKALTLTMACEGYNVVFSPGSLMSHAPKKDRDYPITKVDVQNDRIVVTGVTKYGNKSGPDIGGGGIISGIKACSSAPRYRDQVRGGTRAQFLDRHPRLRI